MNSLERALRFTAPVDAADVSVHTNVWNSQPAVSWLDTKTDRRTAVTFYGPNAQSEAERFATERLGV
jgi:hypothetical protein